jgi:hypothetical protein
MSSFENIYLPVSLGESIDKLTILDIKLSNITDDRRIDVQKEYDLIYEKVKDFVKRYSGLYESMKKVNLLLWEFMDVLRDGIITDDEYSKLSRKTIEFNDIRFRIKKKINLVSGSLLKEQKGYKVTRILVDISDSIRSVDQFVRPIQYYSMLYDQVIVRYSGSLKHMFSDDTIVVVDTVQDDMEFKLQFKFETADNILDIFAVDEQKISTIL